MAQGKEVRRWTDLASFGDRARAKVRARHVRLVFAWSSADLRLIS
jgi:hypothetical protein